MANAKSIVVGQYAWIENGAPAELGDGIFKSLTIFYLSRNGHKYGKYKTDKDGFIRASLPAGSYEIYKIEGKPVIAINCHIHLTVPEGGHTYYIGRITAHTVTERNLLGDRWNVGQFITIDEHEGGSYSDLTEKLKVDPSELDMNLATLDSGGGGNAWLTKDGGNKLRKLSVRGDDWAIKMLQTLAEQKVAQAMFELGLLHMQGSVLSKNNDKALDYWFKASGKGSIQAYINNNVVFENDSEILESTEHSVKRVFVDAESGNPDAQYHLAILYINGLHVPLDMALASEWLEKAAERGHAKAQDRLAILYTYGLQKDPTKWLRVAPSLVISFATLDPNLIDLKKLTTPPDLEAAKKWYSLSANQGNAAAQNSMGLLFANGTAVTTNYADALSWYEKSADQGYPYAVKNLAYVYEIGQGTKKDLVVALALYSMIPASDERIARVASQLSDEQIEQACLLQLKFRKAEKLSVAIAQYLQGN